MLTDLTAVEKVVGAKQVKRALKDGRAKKVFWAENADPRVLQPLIQDAVRKGVPLQQISTMKELGEACGISVGAAVAALL